MTSEANLDTARAKRDTAQAAVNRIEAVSRRRPSSRRSPAGSASARWRRASTFRPAWRWSRCRRSTRSASTFPMPEQFIGKLQRRPDDRAHRRRLSRHGLQGRDPVARCARGAGYAHAAGARPPAQQGAQAAARHVRQRHRAGGRRRRRRHRAAHGRHLQPLWRQRLRREAGAGEGGQGTAGAGRQRPASQLVAERRFVQTGQVREDRVAIISGLADRRAGRHHRPAQAQSRAHAIRIDNTQPLHRRPKSGQNNSRADLCHSPTSSSAVRCSPAS